jgi:hypothetical protein
MVMVKPALAYLDVIAAVRSAFDVPVGAFHVSGEYSMLKAAAANGWIDGEAVALEHLVAIKYMPLPTFNQLRLPLVPLGQESAPRHSSSALLLKRKVLSSFPSSSSPPAPLVHVLAFFSPNSPPLAPIQNSPPLNSSPSSYVLAASNFSAAMPL